MLADVARWLRILGEDAEWVPPEWTDDELLAHAATDDRIIVTRDVRLGERAAKAGTRAVRVPASGPEEALREVYGACGIRPDVALAATRCAACNGTLVAVDAQEAAARAVAHGKEPPLPAVRARHARFWSCAQCGQAYWRGAHWEAIEALRARLLASLGA